MARPTKYQEAYAEQARKLCLLGYTDAELADFFEVSESTINKWKLDYPKFSESIKRARPSLMQKLVIVFINALWASWLQTSIFVLLKTENCRNSVEKYYPPDTTAAIFWLKNRQKDKWRDKVDHELTGKDGGAIQIETSPMSTLFGK